ncbi:hypothetical protein [Erwinia rhapontici]|uniref:hypothetical protein n=1 Tax=Erwinia rhapontici TaxID=55212 RepID=UPI0013316AF5|nr:hypothetical protein [Erwinia rhapontici]MBP2153458.1 hypothetical protein [Erwinia rhapontici]
MLNKLLRRGWRSFLKGCRLKLIIFKNTYFIVLFSFFIISSQAQGREVSQLDVEGIGLHYDGRKDKSEEEVCKAFRPTKKQMIRFFNHAKESKKSGNLLHEYYSPCVSTGELKFKDGSSGHWTVQSSGLGLVIFDNGEAATFFLKDNQWTDPYACTYGLGDDPIC